MKYSDIRELTPLELDKQFNESQRELLNLRIQQANGSIENPSRISIVKKDIAKMLTEKGHRQRLGDN